MENLAIVGLGLIIVSAVIVGGLLLYTRKHEGKIAERMGRFFCSTGLSGEVVVMIAIIQIQSVWILLVAMWLVASYHIVFHMKP